MIQPPNILEERLNALTHFIGMLASIVGLVVLINAQTNKTPYSLLSVIIYGSSLILLFASSTLYHSVLKMPQRRWFQITDHISIYILIAGTYTPLLLITLYSSTGVLLLKIIWSFALFGAILKLFFTGKFKIASLFLYLVMGWLIVVDYESVSNLIGNEGITYLIAGGVFYTIGIVFFVLTSIPFNHVIWHIFVLLGAFCHYWLILKYVV